MPTHPKTSVGLPPAAKEAPDQQRLRWLDQAHAPKIHGGPGAWRPGLRRSSLASDVRSRLFVEDVKALVARRVEEHFCTPEEVARDLGVSRRTLSWRLARESTSYYEIHLAARVAYVLKLLSDPDYSVTQCAWLAGFRTRSAFSNWCSRVLGTPPRALRDHIMGARFAHNPQRLRSRPGPRLR
jgi:AraC-like DNA-binding protein